MKLKDLLATIKMSNVNVIFTATNLDYFKETESTIYANLSRQDKKYWQVHVPIEKTFPDPIKSLVRVSLYEEILSQTINSLRADDHPKLMTALMNKNVQEIHSSIVNYDQTVIDIIVSND